MDPERLSTVLGVWGYPALLVLLILTGMGSPIPEDLLLLTAGCLVFSDVFDWPAALAVSLAGVVISDGVRALPAWSFLRYDLLGACLWVPSMLVVGHVSGSHIGNIETVMVWVSRSVVWVVAIASVLFLIWLSWGREESKL